MLVIPPGFGNLIITITNASGGASGKNTISLGVQDAGSTWDASEQSAIANACRDALTPLWDNSWTVGPVKMLHNVGGTLYVHDDTGTEAGTATSTSYASPAVAHVVTKATGLVGRRFRGRFYLPGVPEASVDEGGVIDGTRVNAVTAACVDMLGDLFALSAISASVLLHDSETGGNPPPTPLTTIFCRNIAGTMRPRQRR